MVKLLVSFLLRLGGLVVKLLVSLLLRLGGLVVKLLVSFLSWLGGLVVKLLVSFLVLGAVPESPLSVCTGGLVEGFGVVRPIGQPAL